MAEDRIFRLESEVTELKGDVKAIDTRISESIIATAKEFGAVRTEMANGFGALRTDMEKGFGILRAEIEKGLGTLRTDTEKAIGAHRTDTEKSIGSLEASIESAKLWMLVTGVGSVILVTFISILGRVLKIF